MEKRVIEEFCRLADEGRLAERLREQASVYAKGRRLDGGVWWDTVVSRGGWKLEKHKVFNWYRVMGPDGKSHAGGSANFISRRIMGISINKLTAWATALRDGGVPETELEQVRAEFRRLVNDPAVEFQAQCEMLRKLLRPQPQEARASPAGRFLLSAYSHMFLLSVK